MNLSVEINGLQINILGAFNARQSSIKEFQDCHRKYGWSRVENLTPERPSMALEFGSATHLYLQERKRGLPQAEALKIGIERLLKNFPKPMFPGDDELLMEHRELAVRLWPMHEAYWADDDEQFMPLGQEVKGRVEVGENSGVFLVFQLDRLVSWASHFWIWDYKTMGKNDDRNFLQYEIDIQPTAYVYGASKVLHTRVAGVVIDGLIKTKVPQFRREHYIRTDDQLLEFQEEFIEICQEIAWRHTRVKSGEDWKVVFYKNTNQCFRYYTCQFFNLCQRDTPMNRMAYKQRNPDYMDDPGLLEVKPEEVDHP